jgi:hypothetical protein
MVEKIKAMFVFEIMGRPPEFLKESLEEHIGTLKKMEGINVTNQIIHEPKELDPQKIVKQGNMKPEEVKGLFSSFAEVEVESESLSSLFTISFRILPSHIEIIEPGELRLKNFELSSVMSELAFKLHKYDEIAKILTLEKQHLENQLRTKNSNIKVEEIKKEPKKDIKKVKDIKKGKKK